MSGDEIREGAVLAAVKPLNSTQPQDASRTGRESQASELELLFQAHYDRVFRTAYRVTGSAADAEDVLQTVFLRLAKGQEFSGPPDNPSAYFARAAINASLDLLRSRKRSRVVSLDDPEGLENTALRAAGQNPETNQEDRELRTLVREAVAKLGPTAAQMFALRYFEGLDNGEIARMMKTSALVVGVTLHRARTRLRKEIGAYLQKH